MAVHLRTPEAGAQIASGVHPPRRSGVPGTRAVCTLRDVPRDSVRSACGPPGPGTSGPHQAARALGGPRMVRVVMMEAAAA